MTSGPSPQLGYNTNVRHRGKLYHIQTEDSGVNHPHIITHLFADGGRIIATTKSSYAEHIGTEGCQKLVKSMMQEQHKAMFIALRDGVYDDEGSSDSLEAMSLDDVAASIGTASRPSTAPVSDSVGAPRYHKTKPPASVAAARPKSDPPAAGGVFGSDLLSEKSLDEVILSYLAEDLDIE